MKNTDKITVKTYAQDNRMLNVALHIQDELILYKHLKVHKMGEMRHMSY